MRVVHKIRMTSNRNRLGVLAVLLLTAPLVGVTPAAAATLEYELPTPGLLQHYEKYGAASPAERRIVVGPETTTLLIDLGFDVPPGPGEYLLCGSDLVPATYDGSYTGDEWNATATHPVPVAPGVVQPGNTYTFHCRMGEEDADDVTWNLVAEAGAPETVELNADPATLVSVYDDLQYARIDQEVRPAALGDVVTVTGPAGTWGSAEQQPEATVTLQTEIFTGLPAEPADDVSVSADGSTLQFTVPTDLPAGFLNGVAEAQVNSRISVPGTSTAPSYVEDVSWRTFLVLPSATKAATTTSLRLNRPVGVSVIAAKAIITVRTDAQPTVGGYVDVYLDGNYAGGIEVPAAKSATVQVTLPKAGRGNHTVVASFRGTSELAASTSNNVTLRILI